MLRRWSANTSRPAAELSASCFNGQVPRRGVTGRHPRTWSVSSPCGGRRHLPDPGQLDGREAAGPAVGHPADDPAAVADLDVRRVEEETGIALVGERAGAEGGDLGIERCTDPADLAAVHRGDAEGLDEGLDPAGADAGDVRLLDDRQEGPLGPSPRLKEARK